MDVATLLMTQSTTSIWHADVQASRFGFPHQCVYFRWKIDLWVGEPTSISQKNIGETCSAVQNWVGHIHEILGTTGPGSAGALPPGAISRVGSNVVRHPLQHCGPFEMIPSPCFRCDSTPRTLATETRPHGRNRMYRQDGMATGTRELIRVVFPSDGSRLRTVAHDVGSIQQAPCCQSFWWRALKGFTRWC